jgi:hypothetical protein
MQALLPIKNVALKAEERDMSDRFPALAAV